MKNKNLYILIGILLAALVVLVCVAAGMGGGNDPTIPPETTTQPGQTTVPTTTVPPTTVPPTTVPPTTTPPETTVPPTTVPPTTAPPEPTVPPTTAPSVQYPDSWDGIGLYTRAELEALSRESYGYGPGKSVNGKRAPYAENEQKRFGQYGGNFIGPDDNRIYLTFDCGYEYTATNPDGSKYRVTEKILDTLKEKNVKGVFFVTMYYVKSQPDLVQRMIDEGHVVGNHSNNHPVMPKQTIDKMIYEVMSLHDYVKEHFGYEMTLFRPPTGEFSIQSLAVVQNLGYKNVHWSFAYMDWDTENQPDPASALQNMTSSAHNGAIYLIHAISTTNAAILGDAIDSFVSQGYEITLFQ
jgi:peptidoglycan-N-acetylmuramic acid deacetylase